MFWEHARDACVFLIGKASAGWSDYSKQVTFGTKINKVFVILEYFCLIHFNIADNLLGTNL